MLSKHYVTFYSPGTFVAETTSKEIDEWNTDLALEMMDDIVERYGARPYGFRFSTRGRSDDELDSKQIDSSGMYYVNCNIETIDEVCDRADPHEEILLSNMEINDWNIIVSPKEGYKWTQPLLDGDCVLNKE